MDKLILFIYPIMILFYSIFGYYLLNTIGLNFMGYATTLMIGSIITMSIQSFFKQ